MSGNKFQGLKVVDINDIPQLFNNTEVKIIIAVGYNNVNQDNDNNNDDNKNNDENNDNDNDTVLLFENCVFGSVCEIAFPIF